MYGTLNRVYRVGPKTVSESKQSWGAVIHPNRTGSILVFSFADK